MSIHSGDECVYQSVLGGRGEKEKVGAKKLVLFQRKILTQTIISVLQGAPSSWQWQGRAEDALYCALYPRAWTVYNIPKVEEIEIWKEHVETQ